MEARPLSAPLVWGALAAVAAQVALVAAPADGGTVLLHAPGLVVLGGGLWLWRRSSALAPVALLAALPTVWALAAVGRGSPPSSSAGALVALGAALAWLVAAARLLRPPRSRVGVEWVRQGQADSEAADPTPWVAGLLVGGAAAGVALWPAIPRAAAAGFPAEAGRVTVALALLSLLVGLALATDLARGRRPAHRRPGRARLLGAVAALSAGAWALASGAVG